MASTPPVLRPRSIRGHLIVLVAALAIPLVALQLWWGFGQYHGAEEIADSEALVRADATATSVSRLMAMTEQILTEAARKHGPTWLGSSTCGPELVELAEHHPLLARVSVVRSDGSAACSGATDALIDEQVAAVRSGRTYRIGHPTLREGDGSWVLPLTAPISTDDGAFAGALVGELPLLVLGSILEGVRFDRGQLVTVTNADRIVLARSHDAPRFLGRELAAFTGEDRAIGPGLFVARGPDFEGVDRTWGQVEMMNGWVVYVGVARDAVLAPARAALARRIGLTVLVLLIGVGTAGFSYHRIARSLRELAEGLDSFSDPERLPLPPATPLEVRAVVAQFDESLRSRDRARVRERTARERYQSIFDNAVFGIFVVTFDGEVLEANAALAAMLGYPSTEALAAAGTDALFSGPDGRDVLAGAATANGVIDDVETTWIRVDGTPITVRLSGRTIRGPSGDPAFEVIVQDITEEKRTEGELRQTQKMEAIGKLAGGIAHDFNNLLTVIGGNLELLEDDMSEDDPTRRDVANIREATTRAMALTTRLLAFARRELRGARPVDVNGVVSNMEQLLLRLIGEDVALETRLAPGGPRITIDPGELEQILMNLVLNARDAMPAGGIVRIETSTTSVAPDGRAEAGLHLSVRDSGMGMDAETSKRIFEPFYTTKPMGKGTGLGLSTVYGIVQRSRGQIEVDSVPNRGTTIKIWFPLATEDTTVAAPERPLSRPDGGSERILVVEDEDLVRVFVKRALEDSGYQVVEASDGADALEVIGGTDAPIDLVLTDVLMPGMKGTELAEHVRAIAPEMPILFMSGYVRSEALDGSIRDNPDLLLRKPFRTSDLRERVRAALDGRLIADVGAHVRS